MWGGVRWPVQCSGIASLDQQSRNRLITVLRWAFSAERGAGIPFLHCCVPECPCPRVRTAKNREPGLAVVDELHAPLTRAQWIFEDAGQLNTGNSGRAETIVKARHSFQLRYWLTDCYYRICAILLPPPRGRSLARTAILFEPRIRYRS